MTCSPSLQELLLTQIESLHQDLAKMNYLSHSPDPQAKHHEHPVRETQRIDRKYMKFVFLTWDSEKKS